MLDHRPAVEPAPPRQPSLSELALVFLKLGAIAFGGPAAHIAVMEEEFVRRRKWLTEEEFLDRLGAANLIPGPSSTEMAIFIGYSKCGWMGLIVAGACFIIPAAILVSLIAAAYVRFGAVPQMQGALHAIKPVVIAIVIQAFWKLARTAAKTKLLIAIGVGTAVLSVRGVNALVVLLVAGVVSVIFGPGLGRRNLLTPFAPIRKFVAKNMFAVVGAAGSAVAVPFSLVRLFLTFVKIGSVLFGGGYVLLAFVESDFVNGLHWLTQRQLLDAVAVGQFTPGPLFTTATFIGYLLAGIPGAIVATIGIFAPGFIFVAASGPLIPRIRSSLSAGSALDGVVAGSLALMGVVAWQLGRAAITDRITVAIAAASVILLLRFRVNPAWLIGTAALTGFLGSLIGHT